MHLQTYDVLSSVHLNVHLRTLPRKGNPYQFVLGSMQTKDLNLGQKNIEDGFKEVALKNEIEKLQKKINAKKLNAEMKKKNAFKRKRSKAGRPRKDERITSTWSSDSDNEKPPKKRKVQIEDSEDESSIENNPVPQKQKKKSKQSNLFSFFKSKEK